MPTPHKVTRPTSRIERRFVSEGRRCVAGVDEVGRGAWAGPVSVGIVVWDEKMPTKGVRDSKLLRPDEREEVAVRLRTRVAFGVGHCVPTEIDELGMTSALRLAAMRSLDALAADFGLFPDQVIFDGEVDFLAGVVKTKCVVKADMRCYSVAAASVLAKVTRDRAMVVESGRFLEFDFASNKGYPAPAHVDALDEHGPCEIHRLSWAPIRARMGLEPYDRSPSAAPSAATVWAQASLF